MRWPESQPPQLPLDRWLLLVALGRLDRRAAALGQPVPAAGLPTQAQPARPGQREDQLDRPDPADEPDRQAQLELALPAAWDQRDQQVALEMSGLLDPPASLASHRRQVQQATLVRQASEILGQLDLPGLLDSLERPDPPEA